MNRVVVAVLMAAVLPIAPGPHPVPPTPAEQYLLAAANRDRAASHLPPLRLDARLTVAALAHARAMAAHDDISHGFPGELELEDRAAAAGAKFSVVSENVAEADSSLTIHEMWMQSPGHRENLLDPEVDAVGISIVMRHGQMFAVEDFARTTEDLTIEEQEAEVAALLAGNGVRVQPDASDARKTCVLKTGYAGGRQPAFVMRYTATELNRLPGQLTSRLGAAKFHSAAVGACTNHGAKPFTAYSIAVMLYP